MEKEEDLKGLASQLMVRCEEKLAAAKLLLNNDKFDDSISRSYYAAFLASRALLLLLGSTPKSHGRMITMMSLKAIKQGILSAEVGKKLGDLMEARQTSDYAFFSHYEKEDAEKYLESAISIINAIKDVLKEKFDIA
mgnify:CR=1 FL=1